MKRDRVVGILGTAVLFFVFFLALSRVATMLADNAFPLGYWDGAAIAFVVTVALCFPQPQLQPGTQEPFIACGCFAA